MVRRFSPNSLKIYPENQSSCIIPPYILTCDVINVFDLHALLNVLLLKHNTLFLMRKVSLT